jgi:hypothetical protein
MREECPAFFATSPSRSANYPVKEENSNPYALLGCEASANEDVTLIEQIADF